MKKGIVGKKIGMTQIFAEDGRLIPVTVIQAGPCPVVQKKTVEKDGYEAIQVGFDEYAENRAKKLVNKPMAGHYKRWITKKQVWPPAGICANFVLRTAAPIMLATMFWWMYSRLVTAWISPVSPKVMDTAVSFSAGITIPALWHTVPSIIAVLAP